MGKIEHYTSEEARLRQIEAGRKNIKGHSWADITPEQRLEYRKKALATKKRKFEARKAMKEQLEILLSLRTNDKEVRKALQKAGIDDESMNNQMALLFNILKQGLQVDSKNAVQAATFIRDTIGEKPTDKTLNVETDFESYIASLESNDEF